MATRTQALSVVIPCRLAGEVDAGMRSAMLKLCLTALDCQTMNADAFEVIVVDDGGDVGVEETLARYVEQELVLRPRFIRNDGPDHGQMTAYNIGVDAARGDVVLLSTDDSLLAPGAVEAHVEAHARSSAPAYMCGIERQYIYGVLFRDITKGLLHPAGDLAVRTFGTLLGFPDLRRTAEQLGFVDWVVTPDLIRHRYGELLRRAALPPAFVDIYDELASDQTDLRWLAVRMGNHSLRRSDLDRLGGLSTTVPAGNSDQALGLALRDAGIDIVLAESALSVLLEHRRGLRSFTGDSGLALLANCWPGPDVVRLREYFADGYERSISGYRRLLTTEEAVGV